MYTRIIQNNIIYLPQSSTEVRLICLCAVMKREFNFRQTTMKMTPLQRSFEKRVFNCNQTHMVYTPECISARAAFIYTPYCARAQQKISNVFILFERSLKYTTYGRSINRTWTNRWNLKIAFFSTTPFIVLFNIQ